jgi:hypothetical protein
LLTSSVDHQLHHNKEYNLQQRQKVQFCH